MIFSWQSTRIYTVYRTSGIFSGLNIFKVIYMWGKGDYNYRWAQVNGCMLFGCFKPLKQTFNVTPNGSREGRKYCVLCRFGVKSCSSEWWTSSRLYTEFANWGAIAWFRAVFRQFLHDCTSLYGWIFTVTVETFYLKMAWLKVVYGKAYTVQWARLQCFWWGHIERYQRKATDTSKLENFSVHLIWQGASIREGL